MPGSLLVVLRGLRHCGSFLHWCGTWNPQNWPSFCSEVWFCWILMLAQDFAHQDLSHHFSSGCHFLFVYLFVLLLPRPSVHLFYITNQYTYTKPKQKFKKQHSLLQHVKVHSDAFCFLFFKNWSQSPNWFHNSPMVLKPVSNTFRSSPPSPLSFPS